MSAWDLDLFDAYDDYDDGYGHGEDEIRCKFCRTKGLRWEEVRGDRNRKKFVLVDEEGNIHDCRSKTASTNEFEDLTQVQETPMKKTAKKKSTTKKPAKKKALLERDIEKRCCDWAERRGWWQRKFRTPFRKNAPDRILLNPIQNTPLCVVLFVEFKATGKDASPAQENEHKEMRAKGLDVRVCDDIEKFKEIITQIEARMAEIIEIQDREFPDEGLKVLIHDTQKEKIPQGDYELFPHAHEENKSDESWLDD